MASSAAAGGGGGGGGGGLLNKIETAHQMYRDGNYDAALGFYTEALSVAKTKGQKIALHSNRAACYLKLHDFKKAAEECTSVLELDHNHTGALMLRAQTLVTLKEYHSALFDVNRLMELNPASEAYHNLEARLRTQLSLAPIPESEAELEEEEENHELDLHKKQQHHEEKNEPTADVGNSEETKTDKIKANGEVFSAKTQDVTEYSAEGRDRKSEPKKTIAAEVIAQAQRKIKSRNTVAEVIAQVQRKTELRNTEAPVVAQSQQKDEPRSTAAEVIAQAQTKFEHKNTRIEAESGKASSEKDSKGWQTIPKPKGHSTLDYGRWDRVEDDSSEDDDDEDDEEEARPQYRFRLRTVGVRPVK